VNKKHREIDISLFYLNKFNMPLILEMPIFMREHFNGMYRVGAYFMAKQVLVN
jgi:hypothetical protein